MSGIVEVKTILQEQLKRLANTNLSKEEQEIEFKRSNAINATAGNIIKISALSVQAAALHQRHHQLGLEGNTAYLEDLLEV